MRCLQRNIATEVLKPLEQAANGLGAILVVEVVAAEVVYSTPSRSMW